MSQITYVAVLLIVAALIVLNLPFRSISSLLLLILWAIAWTVVYAFLDKHKGENQ